MDISTEINTTARVSAPEGGFPADNEDNRNTDCGVSANLMFDADIDEFLDETLRGTADAAYEGTSEEMDVLDYKSEVDGEELGSLEVLNGGASLDDLAELFPEPTQRSFNDGLQICGRLSPSPSIQEENKDLELESVDRSVFDAPSMADLKQPPEIGPRFEEDDSLSPSAPTLTDRNTALLSGGELDEGTDDHGEASLIQLRPDVAQPTGGWKDDGSLSSQNNPNTHSDGVYEETKTVAVSEPTTTTGFLTSERETSTFGSDSMSLSTSQHVSDTVAHVQNPVKLPVPKPKFAPILPRTVGGLTQPQLVESLLTKQLFSASSKVVETALGGGMPLLPQPLANANVPTHEMGKKLSRIKETLPETRPAFEEEIPEDRVATNFPNVDVSPPPKPPEPTYKKPRNVGKEGYVTKEKKLCYIFQVAPEFQLGFGEDFPDDRVEEAAARLRCFSLVLFPEEVEVDRWTGRCMLGKFRKKYGIKVRKYVEDRFKTYDPMMNPPSTPTKKKKAQSKGTRKINEEEGPKYVLSAFVKLVQLLRLEPSFAYLMKRGDKTYPDLLKATKETKDQAILQAQDAVLHFMPKQIKRDWTGTSMDVFKRKLGKKFSTHVHQQFCWNPEVKIEALDPKEVWNSFLETKEKRKRGKRKASEEPGGAIKRWKASESSDNADASKTE